MIRVILLMLALISVPFIVYALFEILRRGPDGSGPRHPRDWEDKAVIRLGFAGFALGVLGLIAVLATQGGSSSGTYVPARVENGKLIDGRFISTDEAPERSTATE